jgi:SAM-dependent methyltransferase
MGGPWPDFLDQYMARYPSQLAFAFHWWHYNAPLLERIRQAVPPPARILNVGTGTGALAVILAAHRYDVVGIDIDARVIEKCREFTRQFHTPCTFEVGDGFDLAAYTGQFDLAFSAGVIEHFPEAEEARLLREQGKAARLVLAAVPTWHTLRHDPLAAPSGARAMRLRDLKRVFRRAGLEIQKTFGYGPPDGRFSWVYRHLLPHAGQWVLQNHLSYACTIGCIGRPRSPQAPPGSDA